MASPPPSPEHPKPPHHEAMVEACKTGRLRQLRKLMKKASQEPHVKEPADGREATTLRYPQEHWKCELFATAISHSRHSTVRYLRSVYPAFDFKYPYSGTIAGALLKSTDVKMLKLIHSYQPHIVTDCADDHSTSILDRACNMAGGSSHANNYVPTRTPKDSDPMVRFIHALLDLGAVRSEEGHCGYYTWRFGNELLPAVSNALPVSVLKKMAPWTNWLFFPISAALTRRNPDALEVLLAEEVRRRKWFVEHGDPEQEREEKLKWARKFVEDAKTMNDARLMAVTERHVRQLEALDVQAKEEQERKKQEESKCARTGAGAEDRTDSISEASTCTSSDEKKRVAQKKREVRSRSWSWPWSWSWSRLLSMCWTNKSKL